MSQHIIFYHQQITDALANHMLIEHVCRGRACAQCRSQGVLCCRGCRSSVGCNGSVCMQGQCRYVVFCRCRVCMCRRHVGVVLCVCRVVQAFVGLCRVECLQVRVGQWCMSVRQYMMCMAVAMQTVQACARYKYVDSQCVCAINPKLIQLLSYGVATISRLLKMIGLFCRISSLLQGSFAKETYHFKEPTNRSHPISSPPQCIL